MAATANNSLSTQAGGTTAVPISALSWSVTTATVKGRPLLLLFSTETSSGVVTPSRAVSVTYGGDPLQGLTKLASEAGIDTTTAAVEAWIWYASTTGAATLQINLDSPAAHVTAHAMTLSDVQNVPPEIVLTKPAQNSSGVSVLNQLVTPFSPGALVVSVFAGNKEEIPTATASTSQTRISTALAADGGAGQASAVGQFQVPLSPASPAQVNMSWTTATAFSRAAMITLVFKPALPVNLVAPSISGTREVGATATCWPGSYKYPATSYAYAWQKDGAPEGTTTQTRVWQAGDVAHDIHCIVTPTNGAGAGAAVASNHVTDVVAASANQLFLTDLVGLRVIQRVGTSAAVQLSGTYTNTAPVTLEARPTDMSGNAVAGYDWTAMVGPTIGGGTWTGPSGLVPQGGWYKWEVRAKNGGGTVQAKAHGGNPFGVGKRYGKIGSSTFDRSGDQPTDETPDPLLSIYNYNSSGVWAEAFGAGDVATGNSLIAMEPGIPITFFQFAKGGTKLHNAGTPNLGWDDTSNAEYSAFITAMNGVLKDTTAAAKGKLEAIFLHVGSGDAQTAVIASETAHEANLRTLLSNIRGASGLNDATLKVYIGGGQRKLGAGLTDTQFTWERTAELAVADDANNYYIPGMTDLEVSSDTTHYPASGFAEYGRRVARAVGNVTGLTALPYKGPKPSPVTRAYDSATGYAYVNFALPSGSALLTEDGVSTGLTAFRASQTLSGIDLVAPFLTVSDARLTATPGEVRLTLPTGLTGPIYADYATGANPSVGRRLFDNTGPQP